ncbi:hypothetical protein FHR83_006750 [Actinoplanes campanulatus]|uniref:Uncharacterized protein n=1 Tax=Actinoplanes campanulatus TaxID=113559 RepID=A0A7W5ANI9_9ACTN|nr:hypothetical protein [Actinoplanes campanulatus]MBB3099044.1 hypothetical protein [Actinoplanes campanulatus]GGN39276.1 hypothetical protein GCM10010109_67070 [Actinoplanes campanulatus]GID40202.1 hypothetical protein Aca09nite_67080 [Actinoplanes campanulatus]
MPDWPDKWKLDNFPEALHTWTIAAEPPPEVLAEVERWHHSRQDDPYGDTDPFAEEGMFDDYFGLRARVYDLYRRPVQVDGRPVVCYYEVQENEHRVVFSHFGVI